MEGKFVGASRPQGFKTCCAGLKMDHQPLAVLELGGETCCYDGRAFRVQIAVDAHSLTNRRWFQSAGWVVLSPCWKLLLKHQVPGNLKFDIIRTSSQSPCNLRSRAHVGGLAQALAVAEMHCRNVTLWNHRNWRFQTVLAQLVRLILSHWIRWTFLVRDPCLFSPIVWEQQCFAILAENCSGRQNLGSWFGRQLIAPWTTKLNSRCIWRLTSRYMKHHETLSQAPATGTLTDYASRFLSNHKGCAEI